MGKEKVSEQQKADIVRLYQQGIASGDIKRILGLPVSIHQIPNIVRRSGVVPAHPGRPSRSIPLEQNTLDIITGLMLGDGHLTRPKPPNLNSRLMVTQTLGRKDFLEWLQAVLLESNLKSKIQGKSSVLSLNSESSRELTAIRSQWYAEEKERIVPLDFSITPIAVLAWYLSDGSLRNKKDVNLYSCGFPMESQLILVREFGKIGIVPRVYSRRSSPTDFSFDPDKSYYYLHISVKDTRTLFEYMGKCPVPSMLYKWPDQ